MPFKGCGEFPESCRVSANDRGPKYGWREWRTGRRPVGRVKHRQLLNEIGAVGGQGASQLSRSDWLTGELACR